MWYVHTVCMDFLQFVPTRGFFLQCSTTSIAERGTENPDRKWLSKMNGWNFRDKTSLSHYNVLYQSVTLWDITLKLFHWRKKCGIINWSISLPSLSVVQCLVLGLCETWHIIFCHILRIECLKFKSLRTQGRIYCIHIAKKKKKNLQRKWE